MTDYEYVPNEDSPAEVPPVAPHGYEGTDTGYIFRDTDTYNIGHDTIAELNRIWTQLVTGNEVIKGLYAKVDALRNEQIDGSDSRLANFWAKAQELANNAGHCEVFDEIADALGGPRRTREYSVTTSVPVMVWVTLSTAVEATDAEQAEEYAFDIFRRMDLDEGSYDINEGDADFSDSQFEVEEV